MLLCVGGVAMFAGLGSVMSPPAASPAAHPAAMARSTATPGVSPSAAPAAVASPTPAEETKLVTATQPIPYQVQRVNDSSLAKGTTRVRTAGVNGVKTLTYQVTLVDGVETGRSLVKEEVTKAPVTKVILVGTKQTAPTRKCDPNYSGCVPIASDVDCAGGSGNGPAYVQGPVRVIGRDIYGLDNDHDGIACE
ncbi:hypothetical protein Cs7R123_77260 [Catellatospora sp. TT07R-123]|nr:hypothetical protein Cs7R123_77260 [Catellatospora sp. TT07R-123]